MAREKFLYFMEQTDGEFDSAADAIAVPSKALTGFRSASNTTLEVYFSAHSEAASGDGDDNDKVVLTITSKKHKDVIDDISRLVVQGQDALIVVADDANSIYCSEHISACAITVGV